MRRATAYALAAVAIVATLIAAYAVAASMSVQRFPCTRYEALQSSTRGTGALDAGALVCRGLDGVDRVQAPAGSWTWDRDIHGQPREWPTP